MTVLQVNPSASLPLITWERLPADFILPDKPVESNLQPLLAAALRESLELAGLILKSMLIASNFGLCATVNDKTVVKAPDWVYVSSVEPIPSGQIRRSYTPHREGDVPVIVMEFISETEGGEYSINPHYPYGKWYFYEQILKVPTYVTFHPKTGILEVYSLEGGKYQQQTPDERKHYWIEALGLFLGVWQGRKAEIDGYWLRWWNESGNLLYWGNELVERERQRAEQAEQQAEQAKQQVEQERRRAEKLAERLRAMEINPEEI